MPRYHHEFDGPPCVFLGGHVDAATDQHFDLYYRPRPEDVEEGYTDLIIARHGDGKNDCRVGRAETLRLSSSLRLSPHLSALRVGRLLAEDMGFIRREVFAVLGKDLRTTCVCEDEATASRCGPGMVERWQITRREDAPRGGR